MLGRVSGRPARTYSIGFDAQGYDEMSYARIAARHFGCEHHEYYVTPEDLLDGIPRIAAAFDQPFGNSSALPAWCCARLAAGDGVARMLAGDGGDELFGGNTRYAKQRVFEAYRHVPAGLRRGMLEPLLGAHERPLARLPLLRKVASYIEQANTPMPARMEMYNLIERIGPATVLEAGLLAEVDPLLPRRMQRDEYETSTAASVVDRMLQYDWKFTLADNDLPKVIVSAGVAGLGVAFPFLDDALVDFSLRLAPELKVRGLKLRWFFKHALRDFLPREILTKTKHGFGLPFGPWLGRHAGLREFTADSLAGLADRGIVRRAFVDDLLQRLVPEHPGYYGEMAWILMMLEQWWRVPRTATTPPVTAPRPAHVGDD
jgi:asparagine synthase (glutamine-hydrolysing)